MLRKLLAILCLELALVGTAPAQIAGPTQAQFGVSAPGVSPRQFCAKTSDGRCWPFMQQDATSGALTFFGLSPSAYSDTTLTTNIKHTAATTGAVQEYLNAKLSTDVSTVTDFGARGDGVSINNTVLQNALNAISSGGTVEVPCGIYKLTSQITLSLAAGKAASVRGKGHDCTFLYFSGSNGINVTYGNQFSSLLVSDLTLMTDDPTGSYIGLQTKLPTANQYTNPVNLQAMTVVRNVLFRGTDVYTTGQNYWGIGESFTNISNVIVENGGYDGATHSAPVSISIASPAVVSQTNTYSVGQAVKFSTTGALPTGINAGQWYYVLNPTSTSYQLSAVPGSSTPVATSGSQSGTQTVTTNLGTAIADQGLTSPQSYAGILNVHGFQGNTGAIGFSYGDFVQGVVINGGTNFTLFGTGVKAIANPIGTPDQLIFADSQINSFAYAISAPAMNNLAVHHSNLIVAGKAIAGLGNYFSVDHNLIQCAAPATQTTTGVSLDTQQYNGGTVDHNTIQGCTVPIAFTTGTYSVATIDGNNIENTSGPWYVVAPGSIGVSISDPSAMTVSQLNTRIPCSAATSGARAVVIDSATSTYGAGLSGGGVAVANAICQGASNAYTAH